MHDMYLEPVDDGFSKVYLAFKTAAGVIAALMLVSLIAQVAFLGLFIATAERQVRTVPGFVASVETREEPVALWLGRRETTYVYLAFDDGHAIEVDSGSDEYASLAGCEEGDAVEVDRTDYVGGVDLDPGEVEPSYGNARLLR